MQQQQQQARGSMSDSKAQQAPRRKSNPYSHQSQHKYSNMPSSQLFGSPPDTSLPPNYTQWLQQRQYEQQQQQQRHDQPTSQSSHSQQPQQPPGQAYSFSGSMMSSLFRGHGQGQAQQQQQQQQRQSSGSGGAVPIPMPSSSSAAYPTGTGVAASPHNMSSPFGSVSSSYGNSFVASSMGGVGNMAGLTGTDFGHVLNRPELDENKYLQSFAFQQSLRQQQQAGGSYGTRRYGNTSHGAKPPLAQSYSIDYSTSGLAGQVMGHGLSPQSSGSYMDRAADHSRYAAMGDSPQAVSYMPMGGQGQGQGLRHQQQGREQSMAHGYEHDRGGLQGGFTATAAPHTQSSTLGAYRAPDVREGGMGGDAYDAYAIEAGIPSTAFAEISMSQITPPAASKNDSARTLSTEKSADGDDDDMFFESDDLLAGDV
jgi:hypothetical protein